MPICCVSNNNNNNNNNNGEVKSCLQDTDAWRSLRCGGSPTEYSIASRA